MIMTTSFFFVGNEGMQLRQTIDILTQLQHIGNFVHANMQKGRQWRRTRNSLLWRQPKRVISNTELQSHKLSASSRPRSLFLSNRGHSLHLQYRKINQDFIQWPLATPRPLLVKLRHNTSAILSNRGREDFGAWFTLWRYFYKHCR